MRPRHLIIAFVPQPSHQLLSAAEKGSIPDAAAHYSSGGSFVTFDLRKDEGQTELYRRQNPGKYFSSIYTIPHCLYREQVGYLVKAPESSIGIASAQVVAGANGEPLIPYLNGSGRDTWFTSSQLTLVHWLKKKEVNEYRLNIIRITVERIGAGVLCDVNELLRRMEIAPPQISQPPRLPDALSDWQSALNALYERTRCTGCKEAHYISPMS